VFYSRSRVTCGRGDKLNSKTRTDGGESMGSRLIRKRSSAISDSFPNACRRKMRTARDATHLILMFASIAIMSIFGKSVEFRTRVSYTPAVVFFFFAQERSVLHTRSVTMPFYPDSTTFRVVSGKSDVSQWFSASKLNFKYNIFQFCTPYIIFSNGFCLGS